MHCQCPIMRCLDYSYLGLFVPFVDDSYDGCFIPRTFCTMDCLCLGRFVRWTFRITHKYSVCHKDDTALTIKCYSVFYLVFMYCTVISVIVYHCSL